MRVIRGHRTGRANHARAMLSRSGYKFGGAATSEAGEIKQPYDKPQLASGLKAVGLKRGGRVGGSKGHHRSDRKSRGAKHHTTVNVVVPPGGGPGAGGPDPATAFKAGLMKGAMAAKAGAGGPPAMLPGGGAPPPAGGPPLPPPGAGPGGPPPVGPGGPGGLMPPMSRGGRAYKSGGRVHSDEAEDKTLIRKEIARAEAKEKPKKAGGGAVGAQGTQLRRLDPMPYMKLDPMPYMKLDPMPYKSRKGIPWAQAPAGAETSEEVGSGRIRAPQSRPAVADAASDKTNDYKRGGRLEAAFHELKENPPKILAKTRAKSGAAQANKQRVAIAMSKAGLSRKSGGRIPDPIGMTKTMPGGSAGGLGRLAKAHHARGK